MRSSKPSPGISSKETHTFHRDSKLRHVWPEAEATTRGPDKRAHLRAKLRERKAEKRDASAEDIFGASGSTLFSARYCQVSFLLKLIWARFLSFAAERV